MKQRPSLTEEAQQWERALRAGKPADQAAFVAWIKRSPQHLEAYLLNLSLETEIRHLDVSDDFDIQVLLTHTSANVIQLMSSMPLQTPTSVRSLRRHKRWWISGAIAASSILAVCLILAFMRSSSPRWTDYTTDIGEQRRIALTDGSVIELNTKSHIRVSIQSNSRAVDLLAGEALFSVHHDSKRPFRVRVGDQIVEDVGTQFSIYFRPDASTTVSVLDGRVQVLSGKPERARGEKAKTIHDDESPELISSAQLSAGEEIRIAAGGKVIKRGTISVPEAAAWREHRLWFDGASLQEVAAEFNRYNKRQLHIGSDLTSLRKRYTGTFDAYDPESFVQALRDDPTLRVQSNDQRMIIDAR